MRVRRKRKAAIPGVRLQKAPKKRNMRAKRLALATGRVLDISRHLNGKSHTNVPDVLEKRARELNVSADCLLVLSDEETPAASEKKEMTDFEKCFGYLMGDGDFLMIASANNALSPWAESYLTDYVRSYDQSVLGKDGKTVPPIDCNPKKWPCGGEDCPVS